MMTLFDFRDFKLIWNWKKFTIRTLTKNGNIKKNKQNRKKTRKTEIDIEKKNKNRQKKYKTKEWQKSTKNKAPYF